MLLRYFALSLLLGLTAGCNYRREKGETPLSLENSFTAIRTYILEPKCLACHNGPSSPKGADLSSYAAILGGGWVVPNSPSTSRLFLSVQNGSMPKGGGRLSDRELALIETWIQTGALEDIRPTPTPPPDPPAEPTYAWIGGFYLQKNCVACHKGQHPKTKLDMRSYESLMEFNGEILRAVEPGIPELSSLYRSLTEKLMPPQGPYPSEEQLKAIEQWITDGANP